MPGAVLAAVVLLGLTGALAGIGVVAYGALRLDHGGGPMVLIGAGILVMVTVCGYGLVNRIRGAQIAAGVVGVFGALAAITALTQGNLRNLAWAAGAVLIGALATIPVSSREWFSR